MAVNTGNLIAEFVGKLAAGGTGPGINDPVTTTWDNIVTAGEDGSIAGTPTNPWTTSAPYALNLASVSGFVMTTTVTQTQNGPHSWEFWLKANTADTGILSARYILFSYTGTDENYYPVFYTTFNGANGRPLLYGSGNNITYWDSPTDIDDGNYHHVVLTMSNGLTEAGFDSAVLYIDGSAQGVYSTGSDYLQTTWSTAFRMGVIGGVAGAPLVTLATVRIYSDVLTESEVGANYASGVNAASTDSAAGNPWYAYAQQ
jgi:hypothetical protein